MFLLFVYDFRTLFIANVRNTWAADFCYLYLIVPMGLIGSVLNSISLIIFLKNTDKNILNDESISERINPNILDAFKSNPYTQPLDSYI